MKLMPNQKSAEPMEKLRVDSRMLIAKIRILAGLTGCCGSAFYVDMA